MQYDIERVHISMIRSGDTVFHNDKVRTVCKGNIHIGFMGITIFGDSYNLGYKPILKVNIKDCRCQAAMQQDR